MELSQKDTGESPPEAETGLSVIFCSCFLFWNMDEVCPDLLHALRLEALVSKKSLGDRILESRMVLSKKTLRELTHLQESKVLTALAKPALLLQVVSTLSMSCC